MSEDISSIKSGQKPLGVDVPRKIAPEATKPQMPSVPGIQKPVIPAPSAPKPSIGLGKTEKSSSLKMPSIYDKMSELSKPPVMQPSITVPGKSQGLSSMFYITIAGILIIGGFLYWFLVLRVAEPEIVLSPTPTPTSTPVVATNLSDIFEGTPVNFEVTSNESLGDDFKTFVESVDIGETVFQKINIVRDTDGVLVPLSFIDVFESGLVPLPANLESNVADSLVLVYGQSESFNQDGSINLNATNIKRTSFVARVTDKVVVETMMAGWEITIADDLADYLLIEDVSKEASVNFLNNTYRGFAIRYKNFSFPDVSVDYAIFDSAGQSYLIISGSRESGYAAMDVLLEQ